MPFADYKDHDDCVSKNRDKDDPDAYCATIERNTKKGIPVLEVRGSLLEVMQHISVSTTKELWLGDEVTILDQAGGERPMIVAGFTGDGVVLEKR